MGIVLPEPWLHSREIRGRSILDVQRFTPSSLPVLVGIDISNQEGGWRTLVLFKGAVFDVSLPLAFSVFEHQLTTGCNARTRAPRSGRPAICCGLIFSHISKAEFKKRYYSHALKVLNVAPRQHWQNGWRTSFNRRFFQTQPGGGRRAASPLPNSRSRPQTDSTRRSFSTENTLGTPFGGAPGDVLIPSAWRPIRRASHVRP